MTDLVKHAKAAIRPVVEKWVGPVSPMGLEEIVRAVIAALREPTEAMLRAGWNKIDWELERSEWETTWITKGPFGETSEKQDTEEAWRAMIDEALRK